MSFRRCICVGASVVLVGLAAPDAVGVDKTLEPTVVVLDASGSMTEMDVDGMSRMDAAKQAVDGFLSGVPDGSPLGLVTYGTGTGSSEEEKEAGCQDISVLARPGEKPVGVLKSDVDGLVPRGYTPIGNSLLKANELLPKEGARSIVLVSDGIDTCAPPPVCEVAKQLKDQGTDLVVHTIGFKVDDAARAELECVANVTGGTYADASSAESLKATLTQATKRKAVGYQLPTETVEFSTSQTDAPTIEPGTLTNPNRITAKLPITRSEDTEDFYAKVSIPKGHRLHVGFTAVPEVGTTGYLSSFTYFPDLFQKEHSSCYEWREEAGNTTGGRPISGYIISRVEGKGCDNTSYLLNLEGITKNAPDNVDMFLAAVPEPTDLGDDFNKTPSKERTTADLGAPADLSHVTPYTPLNFPDPDAPEVEGTVEAEIVEGETQYFATPIGWGQALDVTVEVVDDPRANQVDETHEKSGRALEVYVSNQLMQPQDGGRYPIGKNELKLQDIGTKIVTGTTTPISYANITSNSSAWLGGRHYVQVDFVSNGRSATVGDTDASTELQPVKYRINFHRVGKEVKGPTFTEGAPATAAQTTSATPIAQPAKSEKSGIGMVWWFVIGAALLLLAAVMVVLSRLAKRST